LLLPTSGPTKPGHAWLKPGLLKGFPHKCITSQHSKDLIIAVGGLKVVWKGSRPFGGDI
jgi:hypothetical protein